jgi:hypothetical protein
MEFIQEYQKRESLISALCRMARAIHKLKQTEVYL